MQLFCKFLLTSCVQPVKTCYQCIFFIYKPDVDLIVACDDIKQVLLLNHWNNI